MRVRFQQVMSVKVLLVVGNCRHPGTYRSTQINLLRFDGNARHHSKFMQQFQYLIEQRVPDKPQKMLHLFNQCTGQTREVISGCFRGDQNDNYAMAMDIDWDTYGKDHMVTRTILEDQFKGLIKAHVKA